MDTDTIALFVQLIGFVGGGIWIVAMLRSRIDSLGASLQSLADSILELKSELKVLDDRLDNQEEQILRLKIKEELVREYEEKAKIAEEMRREDSQNGHN